MNNTFNVTEFRMIYSMIEEKIDNLSLKSNQIESLCNQLSNLVNSTDSNLAHSYIKIRETIASAKNKIVGYLNALENEMRVYETRTVENEEETNVELKEINSNIENIASIFNEISGRIV